MVQKEEKKEMIRIHSIAAKIVAAIQVTIIVVVVAMIGALMPVVSEYVPAEAFQKVNRNIMLVVLTGVV